MSRLDELLHLRSQVDDEIAHERIAQARARKLQIDATNILSRGNWNTRSFYAACAHFEASPDSVLDGRRDRASLDARHVAMWLMRDADRSLPEIGRELDMDHTSVRNGVLRVENNPALLAVAHKLREVVLAREATS